MRVASEVGLDVSVCGDLAADPLGLALLIGLGYRDFSLAPPSIPEVRELIGMLSASDLSELCDGLDDGEEVAGLRARLKRYLSETVPDEATTLTG